MGGERGEGGRGRGEEGKGREIGSRREIGSHLKQGLQRDERGLQRSCEGRGPERAAIEQRLRVRWQGRRILLEKPPQPQLKRGGLPHASVGERVVVLTH